MMKLNQWVKQLEDIAPIELAMDYDNVGLLIGTEKEITKVLVALDLSVPVAEEAISKKVDLVLTHHPVFFHPIKRILPNDPETAAAYKLIQNGIGMYAAHTNLDACNGGVNDVLAQMFNLQKVSQLREDGIGRMGFLMNPVKFSELINKCNHLFQTKVCYHGDFNQIIYKVCVIGGAGGDLVSDAVKNNCDVFITGEMRHHEAMQASFYGINIIVAGHYQTEVVILKNLISRLQMNGNSVEYIESSSECAPLTTL